MAKQWSEQENKAFIDIVDTYREAIINKSEKEVRDITLRYSKTLKKENHQLLSERTEQAVYEHLSYFDDLLAGVRTKDFFARKDESYFGKKPRLNNNLDINLARVIRNKDLK
jgi:hypothetical protein